MNDDILKMAREAWGEHHEIFWFNDDGIERFAALAAAAEREACAKVCEAIDEGIRDHEDVAACAAAIRARSNT